jgi:hypothetical protein
MPGDDGVQYAWLLAEPLGRSDMSDAVKYEIGVAVSCSDGACGDLVRVVMDPIARTITHLVVEREHRQGQERLVPVDLVDVGASEIRLRCSTSDFDELPYAEETHFSNRVAVGEVEVHRGEPVHARDGDIGRVQGLVVDPSDHHVTHVLLEEGHLWGKKEVAIPMGSVKTVDDEGVHLDLTRNAVLDLPPVGLADHR